MLRQVFPILYVEFIDFKFHRRPYNSDLPCLNHDSRRSPFYLLTVYSPNPSVVLTNIYLKDDVSVSGPNCQSSISEGLTLLVSGCLIVVTTVHSLRGTGETRPFYIPLPDRRLRRFVEKILLDRIRFTLVSTGFVKLFS